MVTAHIREYKSIVNGEPPVVECFRKDSDQKKFVVSTISQRLNHTEPEPIRVICPSNANCLKIQSVLEYEQIHSTILKDDLIPDPGSGVCICSISGVKGLEF